MKRLIIVDSSDVVRKVGRRILSELDFLVVEAQDAAEARERCRAELPDVAIVDAGVDGALDLMADLRGMAGDNHPMRIFYCLVENDLKKMMIAKRAGATDYLLKPFDRRTLTQAFGRLDTAA